MRTKSNNDKTLAVHCGRKPDEYNGAVNPPSYRCSTILYNSIDDMQNTYQNRFTKMIYGRIGTPTSFALEEAVATLEGGYRAICAPSGLGAITATLLSLLKNGDHLLMVDTAYGPTREFCDNILSKYNIETSYYNPTIGSDISKLIKDNTRVIYCESPGSQTFEVQDIPAITKIAHKHGIKVVIDNTWATPLYFKSFSHGVDVSIHAATKYITGHSDAMLGVVVTTEELYQKLKEDFVTLGTCGGSEEVYSGGKGIRTLAARLEMHQKNALEIASWLENHNKVEKVLYPALKSHPQHEIFKRDFLGSSGLMGVVLKTTSKEKVTDFINKLKLFTIGFSWGGYESLVVPVWHIHRDTYDLGENQIIRLHIGLEDTKDMINDLENAFTKL